jgi:anti-anti-sigma factor
MSRTLQCDVERLSDPDEGETVRVSCQGEIVAGTSETIKEVLRPLIFEYRHVVVDCQGVSYLDSMGLGALVGLKVSANNTGKCQLEFVNLTKRVQELLRMTGLAGLFSSSL